MCYQGSAIAAVLEPLAALRIQVFAEWPYLYAGSVDYEREYLQTYLNCPRSLVILVRDGHSVVGASTGLPLADAAAEMRKPFLDAGEDIRDIFYCAESVVLADYRGRGLGRDFFLRREAHARALGLRHSVFCAVDRSANDPRRPSSYQDNARFWQNRGYAPDPQRRCRFEWTDIGASGPSPKTLTFWRRELAPLPQPLHGDRP